jgi:coenzyme PQQ synthesis protein D (PqqD)
LAHVTVPRHVVHRPFVSETVLLNLQTGVYHGINPVGGRMLEALERAESVQAAAAALAEEFGVPLAQLEQDIVEFCQGLLERQLIQVTPAAAESPPRKTA